MDDIIDRIMRSENAAQRKSREIAQKEKEAYESIKKEAEELIAAALSETRAEIEAEKEKRLNAALADSEEESVKNKKRIDALIKLFDDNKEKWADEMFNEIISGREA